MYSLYKTLIRVIIFFTMKNRLIKLNCLRKPKKRKHTKNKRIKLIY